MDDDSRMEDDRPISLEPPVQPPIHKPVRSSPPRTTTIWADEREPAALSRLPTPTQPWHQTWVEIPQPPGEPPLRKLSNYDVLGEEHEGLPLHLPHQPLNHSWSSFFSALAKDLKSSDSPPKKRCRTIGKLRDLFFEVDKNGDGFITELALLTHVKDALQSNKVQDLSLQLDLIDLLRESDRRPTMQIGLRHRDRFGPDEWIHFMMLRVAAPSHAVVRALNAKLSNALGEDPYLLNRLHSAFEQADSLGDGMLMRQSCQNALEEAGLGEQDLSKFGNGVYLNYADFVSLVFACAISDVQADDEETPPELNIATPRVAGIDECREHFWKIGFKDAGYLSEDELLTYVQDSLHKNCSPWDLTLDFDLMDLLKASVKRRFQQMDLDRNGKVSADEWIHFSMLRHTSPTYVATQHLNKQLRKAMESDPYLLNRLHSAFEQADASGDGFLTRDSLRASLEDAGLLDENCLDGPWADANNSETPLTYFEFVSHALGSTLAPVQLAMYDLSDGVAKWIPTDHLIGHRYEGIWHTGVRAFGREFWYGGGCFAQDPKDVPFGQAVRVMDLGMTLRSLPELIDFLKQDLLHTYTKSNYNVLHHNCVCFANEVVQFLLHGQQIPEEIRMQPKWAQNSGVAPILKRVLNKWLGGFGDNPSALQRNCNDITDEWRRRLEKGDLAFHQERSVDHPQVVKLLDVKSEGGVRTADLVLFQPVSLQGSISDAGPCGVWEWRTAQRRDVPAEELYPCTIDDDSDSRAIEIGPRLHAGISEVLKREVLRPPQPTCLQGHPLNRIPMNWVTKPPPCNICGVVRREVLAGGGGERICCVPCNFELCNECFQTGSNMESGGVFADILTPALAKDLLQNQGWLSWKAKQYFCMTGSCARDLLTKQRMRAITCRLRAELGFPGLSPEASDREMLVFELLQRKYAAETDTPPGSGITFKFFRALFREMLTQSVAAGDAAVPFQTSTVDGNTVIALEFDSMGVVAI